MRMCVFVNVQAFTLMGVRVAMNRAVCVYVQVCMRLSQNCPPNSPRRIDRPKADEQPCRNLSAMRFRQCHALIVLRAFRHRSEAREACSAITAGPP
jgi:hypothetical protein